MEFFVVINDYGTVLTLVDIVGVTYKAICDGVLFESLFLDRTLTNTHPTAIARMVMYWRLFPRIPTH